MSLETEAPVTIRFGVMAASANLQKWQTEAIRELCSMPGVRLELLILDSTPRLPATPVWKKLKNIRYLLWKRFSQKVNQKSVMLKTESLASELEGVTQISCAITRKGKFSQYFKAEDIASIQSFDLDFILRFGFNIIRGEILKVPRFGVWSFHHADELKYRGLPACFWEIYKGDPVTGAIMQRLTDRLDGGVPLQKGYLKTNFSSYRANRDALYAESARWPAQVVRELQLGINYRVDREPSKTTAPIYHNPNNRQMLLFYLKQGFRKMRKWWRILNYEPYWSIAVVNRSIAEIAEKGLPGKQDVQWLPAHSSYYLADPFGFREGEHIHILAERYDFDSRVGSIAEIIGTAGEFSAPRSILNTGSHLSYPFLLQNKHGKWCIPESSHAGKVSAYRMSESPLHLEGDQVLMDNFAGGDNTLIEAYGRWWMFATDGSDGANFKLRVFYSDAWKGPWVSHPGNPVKIDIRSARPAGTPFWWNGELFRPAQDSSEVYGGRIRLMRITELSPERFAEEEYSQLNPLPGSPGPDGIHTLSAVGGETLIDGMQQRLVWGNPVLRAQRLRMLFGKK